MGGAFRILKAVVVLVLFALVPVALVGTTYSFSLSNAQLRAALTRPSLLLRVKADGTTDAYGCACDRTLRVDEVPPALRNALVAVEDQNFDHHHGVDPAGLIRAVLSRGGVGGSTLTQQLAKFAITGDHNPNRIIRKAVEIVTALRIEALWSKDEIIALYLSRSYFGNTRTGTNIIGLRSATQVWFGKDPVDLNTAQAAILAGLLNGPTLYEPIRHPRAAADRARFVLSRMAEEGMIAATARPDPARALPKNEHARPFRDRFVEDHMISEFRALDLKLEPGFYRIVASIDPIAQFQARKVLRRAVRGAAASRRVTRGALLTLDPRGRIIAMVGDLDYTRSQLNIATQARRQAASTAKIATYLAALEHGWATDATVQDDPAKIKGFVPRNYDRRHQGPIPLADCLAHSRNVCTMWLAEQIGFDAVGEMARRIRLVDGPVPGASIVLGAAETTLVRNTAAYGALTNGGRIASPRALLAVLGPYGQPVFDALPHRSNPVLGPKIISRMRWLLRRAVLEGTGHNAAFAGAEAFGKTGTSQENRDAWFIGFTSDQMTTGIWVGPAEGQTMSHVAGGTLPARIFAQYNAGMVERFHQMATGLPLHR